ncbi:MAG TPA: tRNA uridine-5-carboxymethylaminomethyl(34) synthesis GTPase MnmE [Actinobacteria bacterium]|nr:tRNA uridine-5-carboxymethylaminomethyl(34) synthesis GTPase MnmE [Actinomycetota bacterium]
MKDTIAAISTRPGESAIGIVKLSGRDSIKIADRIFRAKNKNKIELQKTYTLIYGIIVDSNEVCIDEVVVSIMKGPRSYTRENIVEINCHGGVAATKKILELTIAKGARIAEPGEFTKRAFLNGRIDLSQAEAVIDIINSKTEQSLKIAANNLKGNIKNEINRIKNEILEIMAQLEASLDFIEEDLNTVPYRELMDKIEIIQKSTEQLVIDEKKGEIIRNGVKIAIVGKPNVGKSSILNLLSKKNKAIVTEIPGTTRDAIEEILYVEGIPMVLIDTAGIRNTEDKIEKIGVAKSLKHIEEAELVVIVLDGSREFDKLDSAIIDKLDNKKVICCINKKDIKQKINIDNIKAHYPSENIIKISALKRYGAKKLESRIKKIILNDETDISERIIINARQKKILEKTISLLKKARKSIKKGLSEEFPSADLMIAYDLLGDITGDTKSDDLLSRIFKKFCIGK